MLHLSSDKLCVFRTHGLASQISSDKLCVLVTWSSVPNYCSFFRISFVTGTHSLSLILLQLSSDTLCVLGTWSALILQLSSDKFWGHGLASHIAAAFLDKFCVLGTWSSISYCRSFLQTSFVFWGHGLASHIAAAFFRQVLCFGDMV